MDESEGWRGEATENQRMLGDGVGDVFDATGSAGHDQMPDVPLHSWEQDGQTEARLFPHRI